MRYANKHCTTKVASDFTTYTGKCIECGRTVSVRVPASELRAYWQGKLIADAMPSVPTYDRLFLISGYCKKCFFKSFV